MKKLDPVLNTILALNILVMCVSVFFVFSGIKSIINYKKPQDMPPPAILQTELGDERGLPAPKAAVPKPVPVSAAPAQANPPLVSPAEKVAQSTPAAAAPPAPEQPAQPSVKEEKKPEVKKPEPPKKPAFKINSKTYLLHDYNNTDTKNLLGFDTGSLSRNGGTIKYFVYKSNLPDDVGRESALRIIFNVSATPTSYVSYFTKLDYVDISKYKQVSFDVKGSDGGETFVVAVDDGKKIAKMMLFASREWRKVVVPFAGLNKKVDLKYFNGGIAVMIDNKSANIKEGSIFIDNITLE